MPRAKPKTRPKKRSTKVKPALDNTFCRALANKPRLMRTITKINKNAEAKRAVALGMKADSHSLAK